MSMRIILNGAGGRMGRALQAMCPEQLVGLVDPYTEGMLPSLEDCGEADCIIDFSNHTGVGALTGYAVAHKLPVVIATTGHTPEELACIQAAASHVPVFHSGNMSLGIAVLSDLVRRAAAMFPDADIEIVETHHNQKLDVPSGTALMLAKSVQAARPESILNVGRHDYGKRDPAEIGIHSLRLGSTVGIHEVIIHTGTQVLSLKHEAKDRSLFAEGALAAARFLIGKAPGLYTMDDIVRLR